ncbi:MAG: nuclease-related domain-containing protein [Caldiserica bacterium]|nr:nuclease-related domain-containing protein [Caldisericota bacterium]
MFATYWSQDLEVKQALREAIRRKVELERLAMNQRVDDNLPRLLAWIAKPLVNMDFRATRAKWNAQGAGGEGTVSDALSLWLSKSYNVFDGVVLEVHSGEFIQLDHIVICTTGVFVLETKTWSGSIICNHRGCRMWQGRHLVQLDGNPVSQNERHIKLLYEWMRTAVPELHMAREHLYPIVVFKKLEKLKVEDDCGMPVVEGGIAATQEIHRHHDVVLTLEQIETLCLAIKHAKPLEIDASSAVGVGRPDKVTASRQSAASVARSAPVDTTQETQGDIEEGTTKGGRHFVRVHGTKEQAQAIGRSREKQGQHPSDAKQDQKDLGVWYFYLDQREKPAD